MSIKLVFMFFVSPLCKSMSEEKIREAGEFFNTLAVEKGYRIFWLLSHQPSCLLNEKQARHFYNCYIISISD